MNNLLIKSASNETGFMFLPENDTLEFSNNVCMCLASLCNRESNGSEDFRKSLSVSLEVANIRF